MPTSDVIEAIAVTAELCGRTFSAAAASVFASDLDGFSEQSTLAALTRCRKEVRGLLTIQDVISRIDDGRPGIEQAWAMIPQDEAGSVVWSDEMAQAWGIIAPLLADGDRIGARMAFKEIYAKLVSAARDKRIAPKWVTSFGHDRLGRQSALIEAVKHNRMQLDHATSLLPPDAAEGLVMALGVKNHPLLAAPSEEGRAKVKELLLTMKVNQ